MAGALESLVRAIGAKAFEYFPGSMTPLAICQELDNFFTDPTNAAIPISAAIDLVAMKANGKPQSQIEDALGRYRFEAAEEASLQ